MRPLRNKDPDIIRLITIRTGEARLWISPSKRIKRLIGGIVARYQELLGIIIYAHNFLGNHYHLLMKAPRGNADEFCENVNREIAKRLNQIHRREGKFWSRRYDDQEVLSEEDQLEAFLYVSTNPTRHGLIEDPSRWPGLNSYEQSITGKEEVYTFRRASRTGKDKITKHTLKISPLPQFEKMSQKKRGKLLRKLLTRRAEELRVKREGKFLSELQLMRQSPGAIPHEVSRSPRPACYTHNSELRREFKNEYRFRRALYDEASRRFRLGDLEARFPEHTFKPPLHRLPRLKPFTPLSPLDLKKAA